MLLMRRSHPFLGIPDEELESIQQRAEGTLRAMHVSALRWLSQWELVFNNYLSYSEVWGTATSRGGLTTEQITEMRVAYEEWSLYKAAYDKWEKHHDPEALAFDRQAHLEKRRREIEEGV